jgi:hypothetical protein
MKRIFSNKFYALIYPFIIVGLFILSLWCHKGVIHTILSIGLGLLSIQLNFIASHVWAHALMLEYHLWNINKMIKSAGQIPSVVFFAFYHHHTSPSDNWMSETFSGKDLGPNSMTAIAHWNSFSSFTMDFPFSVRLPMFICLCVFPSETMVYFLAYEIGVFLLPISHDWVHKRCAAKYGLYYLLNILEIIGLFASKSDHERHHNHDHPAVYQGFTSSGLYSSTLDRHVDAIWNFAYDIANQYKIPMYKTLRWFMSITIFSTMSFSILVLISLKDQIY